MYEDIKKTFAKDIQERRLCVRKELFLNAKLPVSSAFPELKAIILEKGKLQEKWGQNLPLKWLPLEDAISKLQTEKVKVLPRSGEASLASINKALSVSLTEDEVESYLIHKHSLGHLLYFPDAVLRKFLILDQGWLIDALRSLIFAKTFAKDGLKKDVYSNMNQKGIVTDRDREELWSQTEYTELKLHSRHTLLVMEKLDIIARPKSYRNGKTEDKPFYYVPCMVKENAPVTVPTRTDTIPEGTTEFSFAEGFLPSAAFNRLLTSCLALWPVHEKQLFSAYCVLRLDIFHTMMLSQKSNSIQISISNTRNPKLISTRLVGNMNSFVEESLDRILATYGLAHSSRKWYHMKPDIKEVRCLIFSVHRCYVG